MICNPLNFIASAVGNQFQYLMASCNLSQGECWLDFYSSFTWNFTAKLYSEFFFFCDIIWHSCFQFSDLKKILLCTQCNSEVFLSVNHFYWAIASCILQKVVDSEPKIQWSVCLILFTYCRPGTSHLINIHHKCLEDQTINCCLIFLLLTEVQEENGAHL